MAVNAQVEARFAHYQYGKAPAWALAGDQRFSYYVYSAEERHERATRTANLLVLVHGTERGPQAYRDAFIDWARAHDCVILAPLFPAGIVEPGDLDNYKRLKFHGIRYDQILLEMVEEVAARYDTHTDRLLMHGFSGGGQFSHRFLYLHPERLRAVSIGAPGAVTLPDPTRDWWIGVRDLESVFGRPFRPELIRDVRVQLVAGAEDEGTEEIVVPEDSRHWMPDANLAGVTRLERLASLHRGLEELGVDVERVLVPGVRHETAAMFPAVQEFFSAVLGGDAASQPGTRSG
jgi:pimeloyl-ACP methyl ester carboxylesterase